MKEFDTVQFGKRVKELRKSHDMTQDELADELHITRQHLSGLESGNGCSVDLLLDISAFFKVSIDYLLLGKISGSDLEEVRQRLYAVANELTELAWILQQ